MALKDWKKDLSTKVAVHYLRKDYRGIIAIKEYNDGWHFSYFPIGDNPLGKHRRRIKLSKTTAIKLAKDYMKKN